MKGKGINKDNNQKKDLYSYWLPCFSNKKTSSDTQPLIEDDINSEIEMQQLSPREILKNNEKEREIKQREDILNFGRQVNINIDNQDNYKLQ